MSSDTRTVYHPLPFNIQDKHQYINRGGNNPSYIYKKRRTVWLSSAFATSTNKVSTTYYNMTFDVSPFTLYNQTKLSVISFTVNQNNAQPFYIKVQNLQIKQDNYYSSDKEGDPFLFVSHVGATGMDFNNKLSVTLIPQTISSITIKLNDSFSSRDTGYSIASGGGGNFIIGLLFEDDDAIEENAVSMYK